MNPIVMEQLARIRRQNLDEELKSIYLQRMLRAEIMSLECRFSDKLGRPRTVLKKIGLCFIKMQHRRDEK